jgi:hypothetical protein
MSRAKIMLASKALYLFALRWICFIFAVDSAKPGTTRLIMDDME